MQQLLPPDPALTHAPLALPFPPPRYRELLQDEKLLDALLTPVRSAHVPTKTTATFTLSTLTASSSGRAQLRAAGGLILLLDVLMSASNEGLQEACCLVLANMCEDGGDDWKQMLQAGAVFTLVQVRACVRTSQWGGQGMKDTVGNTEGGQRRAGDGMDD
jgi:hypothetical protein